MSSSPSRVNYNPSSSSSSSSTRIRGRGEKKENNNQPFYLRKKLSRGQLQDHPEYQDLFKKCPSCDQYSLKPRGYKSMSPGYIRQNSNRLERLCSNCEFIQKPTTQ